MNATQQMEAVNTIVLTPSGASPAAVTQGAMKMDWTAVVRVYELTNYVHMMLLLYAQNMSSFSFYDSDEGDGFMRM